jgi:cell division protein FtsB
VERVFVWGKKVHDFLTVDYDAIAMLNVSATQELARQMADLSARAEALARENEQLKAQVAGLAAAAEKAALEARLTHMEDTVVRVNAALQRLEEKNGAASGQVLLEVPSATLAQSR